MATKAQITKLEKEISNLEAEFDNKKKYIETLEQENGFRLDVIKAKQTLLASFKGEGIPNP